MSKLFLKGKNVLKLEAQAAKRSEKLLILNHRNLKFNEMSKVKLSTCLIE